MRRYALTCWIVLAAAFTFGSALGAQARNADEASLEQSELARINASLQQLVGLLEVQVQNQRTQLAVQRLDIARSDVIARERELHDAEVSRDGYNEQREHLEARRDTFDSDLEDSGISEIELAQILRQAEVESKVVEQRLWRLEQRILDLQSQLIRAREDLAVWRELVADSL